MSTTKIAERGAIFRSTLLLCFIVCVLALVTASVASASGLPFNGTYNGGETWSLEDWWQSISRMYDMFAKVSLGLGTVSFAAGGFKMMMSSDEKEQAKGKAQMKYTLMAVAAIQLLPLVISAGYNLSSGFHWDPYRPNG